MVRTGDQYSVSNRDFGKFFCLNVLPQRDASKVEYVGDDAVVIVVGIVATVAFVIWRRRTTLAQLRRLNNIFLILAALVILSIVMEFMMDGGDISAVADNAPLMALSMGLLANRFWQSPKLGCELIAFLLTGILFRETREVTLELRSNARVV